MIKTKKEQFFHLRSSVATNRISTNDQNQLGTILPYAVNHHNKRSSNHQNRRGTLFPLWPMIKPKNYNCAVLSFSQLYNDQNQRVEISGYVGNETADTNLYWFSRLTSFAPASMIKSEDGIRSISWKGTKRESYLLPKRDVQFAHFAKWSE